MRFTSILRIIERKPYLLNEGPIDRLAKNFKVTDLTMFLTKERDYTLNNVKRTLKKHEAETFHELNKFSSKTYAKYGPELYAAYFACYLQGKARLDGSNKWIQFDEKRNENILPETYFNVKIEGLDFSHTILSYTGLDNIQDCMHLRTLILRNCPYINEWDISRVCGTFSDTLETLDLMSIKNLTDGALISIGKLKKLKKLNLTNTKPSANMEYICSILECELPDLEIIGFDFKSQEAIDKVKRRIEEQDKALGESVVKYDENNKKFYEFFKKRAELISKNNF